MTMYWKTSSTALVALLTFVATTASANDQFARSVGVEPGAYSTAQLVHLRVAIEEGDEPTIAFILNNPGNGSATRLSTKNRGNSAAHEQIARSVGVDPADYSTVELQQLKRALEDDDHHVASVLTSKSKDRAVRLSTAGVNGSPGHRQMAASLGVDPSRYSTAELVEMRTERWSE